MNLQAMTVEQLTHLEQVLVTQRDQNRLAQFKPYKKQKAFLDATANHREILLSASNQSGKSFAGCMFLAMALSGRYPDWYKGRRWDRPVRIWVASETGEVCRDTIQRLLIGEPKSKEAWGQGAIPKECLPDFNGHEGWSPRPGIPDAIGSLTVRHESGGYSTVGFKSFDQSRTRFQGESLDICYLDEEPDYPIYSECLTRTNATDGLVIMTYTPIKGMTNLSLRFFEEEHKDRALIQMQLEDAEHFTKAQRQRIIDSYEPWELEARTKGYPSMGAGRVFQVTEEKITCEPFDIPEHYAQIIGCDIGTGAHFAASKIAYDRDNATVYVVDCFKDIDDVISVHAARIRAMGGDKTPVAWPSDSLAKDRSSWKSFKELLKAEGLKMLSAHASFSDGSTSREAGVVEMHDLMKQGRFKVFSHLEPFFKEFRLYSRKEDGTIKRVNDHILDASRCATMSRRFAKVRREARPLDYSRMPAVY